MLETAVARPYLKYVGGKTALLPEILSRLPSEITPTYYEPFLGGGAVFFALAAAGLFKRAVLGDINTELVGTYAALSSNVEGVIRALKKHVYDEDYYYAVRAQDPSKLTVEARAARLIYLNRTCFNSLYRVNLKGKFNVPFGRYTNPTICDEANLRAVSAALRRSVSLVALDFQNVVLPAKRGDVVYMDPPYWPASKTANFTAYSAGGFGPEDQARLRDVAKKLIDRGVHVLLSNSDTPPVRELYKGFKIEEVSAPRRVNSKADKRGNVGELLISGKVLR
jgi:DNA adenine methylase